MSHLGSNSERSLHTTTSSLIPAASVPKNFNIPFAIQHGYFRCVRYLLELDHDPDERDSQSHTPLILCSYIENDQWSLSLARNLLEKGAKIALTDHARRNAMHHACALQRIHLVQLYLSCLEFDIESKDCDGNTYLHYAAITGHCEIAELLIRIADKMNVRIDQCVNREGSSAAILALRYGHIECANQITHRNWDEFFVVPRPLSVYESPPSTDLNHLPTSTTSKQKSKTSQNSTTNRTDSRPTTLSFGLLKIIFNESDSKYSTHFAKLCDEGKQNPNRRHMRQINRDRSSSSIPKLDRTKSTVSNGTQHSSVETIITELQPSKKREDRKISTDRKEKITDKTNRLPPRIPSSIQQHASTKDPLHSHDRTKSKMNTPIIHQQYLDSPTNHYKPPPSPFYQSPRTKTNLSRPKTATLTRSHTSNNIADNNTTTRFCPRKVPPTSNHRKFKKKSSLNNRPKSASSIPKQPLQHSNLTFESSTYSKTLFAGRPLSAVLQNHHCRSPVQQIVDPSCSIREAKGAASRYNNPEELFGIKPEDLFGSSENQLRSISHREARLKRNDLHHHQQQYMYQKDVDKLVDLYALQHTSSFRPSAAVRPELPVNPKTSLKPGEKNRKRSSSKGSIDSSRASTTLRQSTLASLNITRRFQENRRASMKTVHT